MQLTHTMINKHTKDASTGYTIFKEKEKEKDIQRETDVY